MKRSILILCLISFYAFKAESQQSDSTTKKPILNISGGIDVYYRFNFNDPKDPPENSPTSFTRTSNSFDLGFATVKAEHSFGKVSATIDLGFGKKAEEFAYNDAKTSMAIKQAYLTYSPGSNIKLTMGTWSTHVGYEMVDPWLNRVYSMSYMFTNGPFTHMGLKADLTLGGKNALMIGISNPVDYRTGPSMPKSLIGQYATGTNNDKLKLYFNFVGGKQSEQKKLAQGDVVLNYSVSPKFNVGANATIQSVKLRDSTGAWKSSQWSGAALYLNLDPLDWFGLTLRTEWIGDKDEYLGFKNVFAPTLAANLRAGNLVIIPEFRIDHAGKEIFYKTETRSTSTTTSLILAAVYHF